MKWNNRNAIQEELKNDIHICHLELEARNWNGGDRYYKLVFLVNDTQKKKVLTAKNS